APTAASGARADRDPGVARGPAAALDRHPRVAQHAKFGALVLVLFRRALSHRALRYQCRRCGRIQRGAIVEYGLPGHSGPGLGISWAAMTRRVAEVER